jgi:hypothetical protein
MAWKNFVSHLAIASRKRVVATALVYGLSLSVRFTSAAGEQTEIPPEAIVTNDGGAVSQQCYCRSL